MTGRRARWVPWLAALAVALLSPARAAPLVPLPPQPPGVAYPTESWPESSPGDDVDGARLTTAIDAAFAVTGPRGTAETRALLVVRRGAVVAERYAPGFDPDSRFLSWSMAKTVTQALVGILVRQGRLDVHAPAGVAAWRAPGDPRAAITLDQLLHMTSGLANADGGSGPDTFAAQLLFGEGSDDVFAYASEVALLEPPGTRWQYSTATSMILAGIAGGAVGGGRDGVAAFLRGELFGPLGMRSAVPEFDAAGTFEGGAFVWATARDWARLGLLYARDGVWSERRIFPEGWVDYSRTPRRESGIYGAHLWLNGEPAEGQFQPFPGAPASAFALQGAGGQAVLILPTQDLVVVRLGESGEETRFREAMRQLVAIAAAFPELPGSPGARGAER
jgi:CubicO group peptidase (beta-lactamase class C family)